MTLYRVRANLRFSRFGDQFVGLDLRTSRYVLLEGEAAQDLVAFEGGLADERAITRLFARDLVEAGPLLGACDMAASPTASLLDHELPRPSPWLLYRSLAAQRRVRRSLSRRSIADLVSDTGLASAAPEPCVSVAAAFARATRYRSATDQCLVRSLAMRAMLARRGLGVDLVIGVTLPFAAHCWLQAGTMVLNDDYDRVRNFKPLLTAR